jgi:hypothetical protein
MPETVDVTIPTKRFIKPEYLDNEQHETVPTPHSLSPQLNQPSADVTNTKQIRYYHDRIDFHGDILLKPTSAKSMNQHLIYF